MISEVFQNNTDTMCSIHSFCSVDDSMVSNDCSGATIVFRLPPFYFNLAQAINETPEKIEMFFSYTAAEIAKKMGRNNSELQEVDPDAGTLRLHFHSLKILDELLTDGGKKAILEDLDKAILEITKPDRQEISQKLGCHLA